MKLVVNICRILVGALFIFSGAIKLNDPLGTAYKLEEYFQVFSADFAPFFEVFIPYSIFLSVFICGLEIILGIALLINYRMKWSVWLTLLLIVFFTFLTFYSWWFDKVKECGCFGTLIKLTPKQSFFKDVILLVLVLVIFFYKDKFVPFITGKAGEITMVIVSVATFFAGYYAVEHLPYVDSLNFKVGNDLTKLTVAPPPKYIFTLEKDGKQYEFSQENYPTDTSYKYVSYKLIGDSAQYIPVISGFDPTSTDGQSYKAQALKGIDLIVVVYNVEKAQKKCEGDCMKKISTLTKELEKDSVASAVFTKVPQGSEFEEFRHEHQLSFPWFTMDDTVLKMMIRANPGILLLKNGVVVGKWHHNDTPTAEEVRSLIK